MGLDIERVFVFVLLYPNGRSIRSPTSQFPLRPFVVLSTVTPLVETSLMAAILNPTALSAPTNLAQPIVPESLFEGSSFEGSSSLAPWNLDLEPRRPVRHLQLVAGPSPAAAKARRSPMRVLIAGLGLAVLVAFAAMGVLPFLGADAAASTPASSADSTSPAGADAQRASTPAAAPSVAVPVEIVVQSGDSLWSVARRLQPRGDLRRLVDRLIERVGATSVTRGQHINVSGLLD